MKPLRVELISANGGFLHFAVEGSQGKDRSVTIDYELGYVDCDCPDYYFNRYVDAEYHGRIPDIGTPRWHCHHIETAIAYCIRQGYVVMELPAGNNTAPTALKEGGLVNTHGPFQ